jgi:glycosyltransferase involved in cell wall biosynthesis
MRATLNLPQATPLIAYAGMTFKYRGLDVLLRAFVQIADRVQLVLAGGRDAEVSELRALAVELGVAARVHFVGRLPAPLVAQYLAAADVLVIPDTVTDTTASPLKMFEYMAMERPIVSVDRASLREILGDAALYFPSGDTQAFAAALRHALEPEARSLGEEARARAAAFTYARRAAQIVVAAEAVLRQ